MSDKRSLHGAIYVLASVLLLVAITLPIYGLLVMTGAPYALCYWVMSFLISGGVYLATCLYLEQTIEVGPFLTLTLCFATIMTAVYVALHWPGALTD